MQQPLTSMIQIPGTLVLALFIAGCASSGGPAPVEHRDVVHPKPPVVMTGSRGLAVVPAPEPKRPVIVAGTRETAPAPAPAAVTVATAPVRSGSVTQRELNTGAPAVNRTTNVTAPASDRGPTVSRESVAAAAPKPVEAAAKPAPVKRTIRPVNPVKPATPTAKAVRKVPPKTPKPQVTQTASRPAFIWPAKGSLVRSFTDAKSMGIGISGRQGDPVAATADGKVIFSGLGPRGYGKLLIVKHEGDLLSVYAHNNNLLVKEGQAVRQGQKIAELGSTGTDRPKLHFEIRRQGKPVDPLAFLPRQ